MRCAILAVGVSVAAWLAGWGGRARASPIECPEPVPWQEPSPLMRLFLQFPFEGPATVPPGALRGDAHLVYSNSLLVARNDAFALDVHVETAELTTTFRRGVRGGVEIQLALPAMLDSGGFLDRPIEVVEGWFDAANPQRAGRPRGTAVFRLLRGDGTGIDRLGTGAGIGDAWGGVKVELAAQRGMRPALSIRGGVKVPTGRSPFGSGTVDVGGSVLSGWTGERLAVRLEIDGAAPTGELRAPRIRTRPYATAQAGLAWEATGRLVLHGQVSGHLSPLEGTGIPQVDAPTFYVLAGLGVAIPAGLEVTGALVENVFSPYRGADVAFVLGLRSRG